MTKLRLIGTVAAALLLGGTGISASHAEPAGNPIADRLTEEQKQQVRAKLIESFASIDANIERARQSNQPLLAEFASLSRDYVGLILALTLGEDEHGNAVPPPGDDEVISLIDRTQDRITVIRERHADNPALAPVMPHIDMMSRQLAANRMQILSRRALAGDTGLTPEQVQGLFDRARDHLDDAEHTIAGTPAEQQLGERIAEARERLEQGRPVDDPEESDEPDQPVRP